MKDLFVNLGDRSYNIYIDSNYYLDIPNKLKDKFDNVKFFIITDENVDSIYGEAFYNKFLENNLSVYKFVVPSGEKSKSIKEYERLCEEILKAGITRKDVIVAFGGGVVGDLSGFCAATILRGVSFVQVPTTLLSQVDSSVGGKTGINTNSGKNLIGAFYQPKAVFIDTNLLNTLSDRVFSDGMAEVIKYGCIWSKYLFNKLTSIKSRKDLMEDIENIVYECCDIKRHVVEEDEQETGLRKILNFGHTFGHVIEKYFDYNKYTHGEAVAAGMYAIVLASENMGICNGVSGDLGEILDKYSLPKIIEELKNKPDDVLNIMSKDKKSENTGINFVFISEVGKSFTEKKNAKDMINILEKVDVL